MSKLLVIIGATGKQGGSVIKSILSDPIAHKQFKLRGVTRDTSKPASQALEKQGVEMVSADLDDKESLVKAMKGAYGVFAVTDFWGKMDKEYEIKQGKNLADAAKETGVEHYVWSSLINTTESTGGKLSKIDHFVGKAEIGQYAKSLNLPMTLFLPGLYGNGITDSIYKSPEGHYIISYPSDIDAQIPFFDPVNDTGKFVKAIFLNKDKTLGKEVYGATKYYTPQEIVEIFEKTYPVDGKGVQYVKTAGPEFVEKLKGYGLPERIAEELLENAYLLNKEFGYYAGADLAESHSILTEKLTTVEEYLKAQPAFANLK